MNNVTRFPFQLFEAINAHGYSMDGQLLHVKVLFIRYIDNDACFDCVIESEGTKSRANTHSLWRDGDPIPNIDNSDTIDVGCIPPLTEEEIINLKDGDELVHILTNEPTTVVSIKEAPECLRMRAETDKSYFNLSVESMIHYGWA